MSGKIFDLTPETEGPRRPVRRSASWEYGSSAGEVYLARKRALERAAADALRDAAWAVRRRAARGQGGGDDAVTLALMLRRRGVDEEVWEREVRRAAADRAEGTAYLARKREERLRRQAAEAAEAGMVQAQAEVGREGGALSPALSGRIGAKRGGGQPLEATVRRGMEGVFGVSFGHVRIHADPEADALNQGVAAIAFTVGSDVFFRAGAYQPHSAAGQHLLAHELTHVVQQRAGSLGTGGGNTGGTMTVGAADDRHEQEAEATAHRVIAALQQQALQAHATTPGAGIARHYDPDVALAPSARGVARVAAPAPRSPAAPALFSPTPPGARCLPLRRPPFAFVLTTGGANLHPTEPQETRDLAASLGLLPVTTKVEVLTADPAHDWARVCVLAGPAAGLVGRVGWVRYSWLDAQWPAGDPDATLYVIQGGDTALGLAARFYGLAGSDHPETNADLRRYVEVLVRVNQHGSYWIDKPDDGDPLIWMRAQVRATYAMWVPSRAWAGKAAGAMPSPSLTGGAWATVHQQLQAQGWGGVTILQAVSLFAQDVAVVGDRAVLPVLQDLASTAVAPAVLMARLGALAAKKPADVPAALLTLLERKAHELLASLLGAKVLARLGGALHAILTDPGTFIGNLVAALNAGVGHLIDHVAHHFGEDALGWLMIAALADAVRGVAGGRGHDGQDAPGATPHQDNPKHEAIAQQIVTKLEHIDGAPKDFAATRSAKEGQAHQLWSVYHGQLERGINLSITFATKPDDAGGKETLDFTVVIAPNTTTKSGRIPVEKIDPSVDDAQAGTRAHPFPIIWPKPASKDYPTLYFGGRSASIILQTDLKQQLGEKDATGTVVKEYKPEIGGTLPDGTTIGLAPQWHLGVGTVVGPLSNAKTPSGRKITDVLLKFGFKPSREGMDGDHVHEIQMGGKDEIPNLWPLDRSPNRGAGSILRQIVVHGRRGRHDDQFLTTDEGHRVGLLDVDHRVARPDEAAEVAHHVVLLRHVEVGVFLLPLILVSRFA